MFICLSSFPCNLQTISKITFVYNFNFIFFSKMISWINCTVTFHNTIFYHSIVSNIYII